MSQSLLEKLQKKPVPKKKILLKPTFGTINSAPSDSKEELLHVQKYRFRP